MTSEKPVERDLAEAWFEVWESRRLEKIQLEGASDKEEEESSAAQMRLNPAYEAEICAFDERHALFDSWKTADDAFAILAGGSLERQGGGSGRVSVAAIIEALEAAQKNGPQASGLRDKVLHKLLSSFEKRADASSFGVDINNTQRKRKKSSYDGGSSTLASMLFSAANEPEDDAADQEEEKKSSYHDDGKSKLAGLLFDAADDDDDDDDDDSSSNLLSSSLETKKAAVVKEIAMHLGSFKSQDVDHTQFRIVFCPSIGKLQAAFSSIMNGGGGDGKVAQLPPGDNQKMSLKTLKMAMLKNDNNLNQSFLSLTPGSSAFDSIYSALAAKPSESTLDLDDFTAVFLPNYFPYKAYCRLSECLPAALQSIDELNRMDREQLESFYNKDASSARQLLAMSGKTLSETLEQLPEVNVSRRHFIMLLEPKHTKLLLRPKMHLASGEEGNAADEVGAPSENNVADRGDEVSHKGNGAPLSKSSVEAAFRLINASNKPRLNRKELVTAFRDNGLVQRLLLLPAKNHARSKRWKSLMNNLNGGKFEDVGISEFFTLFDNVQDDTNQVEEAANLRASSRRSSKEVSEEAPRVIVKSVPILDVNLAEKYVSVRRGFDKLDLNDDGVLSADEIKEQFIRDEELRNLLGLELEDVEVAAKRLGIHAMNANIDWEMFRTFFIPDVEVTGMESGPNSTKDELSKDNRHRLSENVKNFAKEGADIWRSGDMDAERMMHDMVVTMEAMIDTTKDDQESSPALAYNGEVVEVRWAALMRNKTTANARHPFAPLLTHRNTRDFSSSSSAGLGVDRRRERVRKESKRGATSYTRKGRGAVTGSAVH